MAKGGITLGFAVDGTGLVSSSDMAEEFAAYLESQLLLPVKIRSFANEDQLYNWLTRFNEVDVAWLSDGFLEGVPAGQLYSLSQNRDHSPGLLQGEFVSRQGVNLILRQQLQAALLGMNESTSGRALLSKLGTSRFVSQALWLTPAWNELDAEQPATGSSAIAKKQSWQSPAWKEKSLAEAQTVEPVTLPRKASPERSDAGLVAIRNSQSQRPESRPASPALTAPASKESPLAEPLPVTVPSPASSGTRAAQQVLSTVTSPAVKDRSATAEGAVIATVEEPEVSIETTPVVAAPGQSPTLRSSALPLDNEAPIALVADSLSYDSKENSYEALGDVVLRQAGVELKSDELLWQAATQDAAAQGSVRLSDAGTELSGDRLQYNMATGQGQVHDGRVFIRDGNFHLSGAQIEKQGPADYFVERGSFTTCDGEIPDWKFSAREIDVTLGGYARAKDVWFYVKDVPVLYTPYLLYPVKTERESGLLAPGFGYSNNKGVKTSLAWYQVIDRSMDATVYLDYLSEIGLGKGLEYRYALNSQNNGKSLYYHVTGLKNNPDLYYVDWEHRGKLPGDWQLTADIEYVNEKQFFEEFGDVAEDYNRDKTVSTLMLSRNWEKLNLVGYGRYIQDLETDNDDTLQRLPEFGLGLVRYRLGDTPFYAGLESYATRFWRKKGEGGERVFLKPSLSAVFKPGPWLEIVPEVAFYERLYNADARDKEQFLPEFSLSLGTKFLKAFDFDLWGYDRLQHSVEPRVTYTYVPDEFQESLPLFDLFDRIEIQNVISYSLVNRLIARSTKADGSRVYREILNLRLSQNYDVDEERQDLSGNNQPFSDVRIELDVSPGQNLAFHAESLIPVHGDNGLNSLAMGSTVRDDRGNTVTVDYTYKDESFAGVATDYVRLQIDTPIFKPVYARFEERYDFRVGRELEKLIGLEYRAKCWSIQLTYRNRYLQDGADDQEFGLTFVLAGLGQSSGFGSGFGVLSR